MISGWPTELKQKLGPIVEAGPGLQQQSAVCLILRSHGQENVPEILFIKRALRVDDPWSGHMAFPGGRRHLQDQSIGQTAVRETFEEIGMKLSPEQALGALNPYSPKVSPELAVYPFIYFTEHSEELILDVSEVEEIYWVPLSRAFSSSSFGQQSYSFRGMKLTLPTFSFSSDTDQDRHIWGVTYVILLDFLYIFAQTSWGQTLRQRTRFDYTTVWNYGPYK